MRERTWDDDSRVRLLYPVVGADVHDVLWFDRISTGAGDSRRGNGFNGRVMQAIEEIEIRRKRDGLLRAVVGV